jgi:protein-disulfide isomerase
MSRREWKSSIVNALLGLSIVILMVAITGTARERHRVASLDAVSRSVSIRSVGWQPAVRVIGTRTAPERLVVFVDYTCPHSRALLRQLLQLQHEDPKSITVDIRDFPLNDSDARDAALAARCAASLGYDSAIDELLLSETVPSPQAIGALVGGSANSDASRSVRECTLGPAAQHSLAAEVRGAYAIGVDRVPSVIVGDRLIAGLPPVPLLNSLVRYGYRH